MRISDWSSDVCSSDLLVICRSARAVGQKDGLAVRHGAGEGGDRRAVPDHGAGTRDADRERAVEQRVDGAEEHALVDLAARAGVGRDPGPVRAGRSEEHTSELQSLMRISYAVFCLNKKTNKKKQ